jgi:putative transposase
MARPLRIEFAGAIYHITSRGNARADVYLDEVDRHVFLAILAQCCQKHHWRCHAYCLMPNHYHLLVETVEATLSRGMHFLNGVYTQTFNKRHERVGHVFQGRFKSVLVERDAYLLELSRYIVLNPVRALMVNEPEQWQWSSYRATAGLGAKPKALTTDWILSQFCDKRGDAIVAYMKFVQEGRNCPSPWTELKNQVYLGADEFVEDALRHVEASGSLLDVPRLQRSMPRRSLAFFQANYSDRDTAMQAAYNSGHYTQAAIAAFFKVGRSTVSRTIAKSSENGQWEA